MLVFKQHDPSRARIWNGREVVYRERTYRLAQRPAEVRLRRLLKKLRIPLLDVPLDHKTHTFLPHDFHLNGAGYAKLARAVGAWLRQHATFRSP